MERKGITPMMLGLLIGVVLVLAVIVVISLFYTNEGSSLLAVFEGVGKKLFGGGGAASVLT